MASRKGPRYQVTQTAQATADTLSLVEKATSLNKRQQALEALKAIFHQLQTAPLNWGDPEYRTRKQGGRVYHGIHSQVMRYVVFKAEKVVCLLSVKAVPGSPLG